VREASAQLGRSRTELKRQETSVSDVKAQSASAAETQGDLRLPGSLAACRVWEPVRLDEGSVVVRGVPRSIC
jgi:hypothetical protein